MRIAQAARSRRLISKGIPALTAVLLAGCTALGPSPTATPSFTVTPSARPTLTLTPTPTEDPLAGGPKGATSVSADGMTYFMDTSNNGFVYHYVWDKASEKWSRLLGKFFLWDGPSYDYVTVAIYIDFNVDGGQNLVSVAHEDFTTKDIPAGGVYQPPPLSQIFSSELWQRYYPTNHVSFSSPEWLQFQHDMRGDRGRQAFLTITTSSGESAQIKLSRTTGFVTTIVSDADLEPWIGRGVSKWKDPYGDVYLSEVAGVDADGNALGSIACVADIADLSDEQVRWLLFSVVGNVITREDQQTMSFTALTDLFASYSARQRADGAPDVVITRSP